MSAQTSIQDGLAERLGPLGDGLERSPLPACVRDTGGRYVAVNRPFADLVGLEGSRLLGKTDNALQPADVASRVNELDALVLEAHGPLDAHEVVLARDGRRPIRVCRFPLYRDGQPWAICAVIAPGGDIEGGRRAREELQAIAGQAVPGATSSPRTSDIQAELEQVEALETAADAARNALAAEREARAEAEQAHRDATERLAAVQAHVDQLESTSADVASELERLRHQEAAMGLELAAANDKLAELACEPSGGERPADDGEERERLRSALEEATERNLELTEKLDEALAAQAKLRAGGDEATTARDRAVAERDSARERIERLLGELAALRADEESQTAQFEATLAAASQRADRADHQRKLAHERVATLESALRESQERLGALTDAHGPSAEHAATSVDAERLAQAESLVADLRQSASAAEERLDGAESLLADMTMRYEEAAARAITAERQVSAFRGRQSEADAIAGERDELLTAQKALAGELDLLREQHDRLTADHGALTAELEQVTAARDRAEQAHREAAEAAEREALGLRDELASASARIVDLEKAIALERERREQSERAIANAQSERDHLPDAAQATAEAPAANAPASPTAPAPSQGPTFGSGPPAPGQLPSLEIASEQARQFEFAAPEVEDSPPPGFTPQVLNALEDSLVDAATRRSAGRAAIESVATALGWQGAALWSPDAAGTTFGCTETWTSQASHLQAWETMAWRARLTEGLIPATARSDEARWSAVGDVPDCPRARAAEWAGLQTVVSAPLLLRDGTVLGVMEFVVRDHVAPDARVLSMLTKIAARVAMRFEELSRP